MKNFLLTSLAAAACVSGLAIGQYNSTNSAENKLINMKSIADQRLLDILEKQNIESHSTKSVNKESINRQVKKSFNKTSTDTESIVFTAFAKSLFVGGYSFDYENGDLSTYEVTVTLDGDKATFTNLFNIDAAYPGSGHIQYDIVGDYDAASGKITLDTPADFENGCLFGYVYNYYNAIVRGGEAFENGQFDASGNTLTFTVAEDLSTITTDQNILLQFGSGTSGYTFGGFKYINMYQPQEGAKVISMCDDVVNFREDIYPDLAETKTLLFANIGSEPAEYVVDCESDDDCMSCMPLSGEIEPMSLLSVDVTFCPQTEGSHEGIITLATEEDEYIISALGGCIGYPDYSCIVKSGEFAFSTCMEFPWEIGDQNGNPIVRSTNIQQFGDSWLKAKFTVPEGKIATVSWKGNSFVTQWFATKATITNDMGDDLFTSNMDYEELGGSSKFAPGEHYLLFNYNVSYAGYTTADDWMMICDLETTYEDLVDVNALIETGSVLDFSNFLSGENSAYKNVIFQNLGAEPLKVTGAKSSDYFIVYPTDDAASTMNRLNVSVEFIGSEAGLYYETITINTTAGDYEIQCKARVRQTPDYSKIMAADSDPTIEMVWKNNEVDPFILDETTNQLVNANACELDSIENTSWIYVEFEIPSGKMGHLTWDASLSIAGLDEDGFNSDIAWIDMYTAHGGYTFGGIDHDPMDSNCAYNDHFAAANTYTPGINSVQWRLYHKGDNQYGNDDEFRIWNVRLELEDFEAFAYSIDKNPVDFGTLYQGKSASQRITLTNEGSDPIMIESIEFDGPISIDYVPSYSIGYTSQFWLDFKFTAEEAGAFNGSIIMHCTNGQDIVIPCTADVLSTDGYLLVGDFEDDAAGWTRVDADGDGKGWDLLWSLFGGYPEGHTHSGADGLGSTAYYYYAPDLDPDNWAISPMFEVPADGEYELSWWIGTEEDEYEYCFHTYSIYVGEDASGLEDSMDEVFTEMLDQTGWQERKVSLADYAGKTVCVAIRHYDSLGQRLLKLDDMFVKLNQTTGVNAIAGVNTSERQVYSLSGVRQQKLTDGINIIRTVKADGSVDVQKLVK